MLFEIHSTEFTRTEKLTVPIILSTEGSPTIKTTAMIDSGATENFIDLDYAKFWKLNLRKKPTPGIVRCVDGTEVKSGPVTHDIQTNMTTGQQHHETIRLHAIKLAGAPVILGIPWLRLHNPLVDWRNHTLQFIRKKCATQCLTTSTVVRGVSEKESIIEYLKKTPLEEPEETTTIDTIHMTDFEDQAETQEIEPVTEERQDIKEAVPEIYHDYLDLFETKEPTGPPKRRIQDHSIPIEENKNPPFEKLRELDERRLKVLKEYLDINLERGWIRRSSSPAGAPICFVRKKDGTDRLCIDYRGLNDITRKDRTPLPLIQESLDRLSAAKIYTKLDIKDAYHNLRIAEGDEWKTAFRTKYGLFEYLVMPFGLTNAPGSFQRWINEILSEFLDIFCIAYLDDILIYSDNIEDHQKHVQKVLQKLREAEVTLKATKCEFHTDTVEYLGFVVKPEGVLMDTEKIKTVKEWPTPGKLRDVQSFLGFCNFYRRFIKDYSKITQPLTKLSQKDVKFHWDQEQTDAFNALKLAITTEPILMHYNPDKPIILETDASDYGMGMVCSQPDNEGRLHPLGYYSKQFHDSELNYDIHDKELFAIVKALEKWDKYCRSNQHQITILTDHKNLEHWKTKKDLNQRQARWSEKLANYDFIIKYRPGKLCGKPDILSRESGDSPWEGELKHRQNKQRILLPEEKFEINALEVVSLASDKDMVNEIKTKTENDPDMKEVLRLLKNNTIKHSKYALGLCKIINGILTYDEKIWIPTDDELRLKILKEHHDVPTAGHPGQAKTLELISRKYYWPDQRKYCARYVDNCDTCKRIKPTRHAPYGLLKPLEPPKRPWDSLSMDFVTGLPEKEGYDTILVVVDRLTKMAHYIPTSSNINAKGLAKLFLEKIVKHHGLPTNIITDRGSLFTSEFWTKLMKALGTSRNLSTAFHPETDGQTERINAIMEQFLRAYCSYQQDNWVELLPLAEFAFNNTKSDTTTVTPFFANFGYHPRAMPDLGESDVSIETLDVLPHVIELQKLHEDIHAEIIRAHTCHAEQANKKRHPDPVIKPGDKVWLKRKNIRTTRPSEKLDWKYLGPYQVLEKIGARAYKLDLPPGTTIHPVFHISLLEPTTTVNKQIPGHIQEPPPPIEIDNEQEWEVEDIIDSRLLRGKLQYRVKWKGYPDQDKVWYPDSNFHNSQDLTKKYHQRFPEKPKPKLSP